MAEFFLTNKAVEDLSQIWKYTLDEWSEKQADSYYKMLMDSCRNIAENPKIGKNYEVIREDLFGLKANRHIIFYRKSPGNIIEITRILHERMDLKNRIME
jgi:toxin ParE1/3/4